MSNEAPKGAPGPVPKNRTYHYLALLTIVATLVVVFVAVR